MPEPVEVTDPEGVDYTWVMQVTFLTSLVVGVPIVVALSLTQSFDGWTAMALYAVRVGALIWLVIALVVYVYARRTQEE